MHATHLILRAIPLALAAAYAAGAGAAAPGSSAFTWSTVVNNGDYMPTDACDPTLPDPSVCRTFNSYNQPSVNAARLVVMRARSRGGQGLGQAVHGVYTRDMAVEGPVVRILDRSTAVPQPNNRGTVFGEPPSFPRIDIGSDTLATRGNHQPVWRVTDEGGETVEQLGTSGIYTTPFGPLVTGASKLGSVPAFSFFEVPESPGTVFDVFPGAPAVTGGSTIVFKGNYTEAAGERTGVYYRELTNDPILDPDGVPLGPAGGFQPVVLIANSASTVIPGTTTLFGSTAPPSAAAGRAVFAGFDNEDDPTLGGIYLAPLAGTAPALRTLVSIGGQVPGENRNARFNRLGEGLSFDGRFVAFWGAWGQATRTLVLQCPSEGNAARRAFCNQQHPNGFAVQVPVNQGIFVHDVRTGRTHVAAKTPDDFDDMLFWNFSGRVPGTGDGGEGGDDGDDPHADGELARWRASAFAAVSGRVHGGLNDARTHVAFKARTGALVAGAYVDPVDGIYLAARPGKAPLSTVIESGMDATIVDPEAVDPDTGAALTVTEVGIERDGFRGNTLVINARMGVEESGWGGIYLTGIRR